MFYPQVNKMVKDLSHLVNDKGFIAALAIDQRGALKRMLGNDISDEAIEQFKVIVSEFLTPYASSILLDPEYGLPAAASREPSCGLMLAYEKTGYDKTEPGRLPDLLDNWSVKRLKEAGANAIKLLIYVDVDESVAINIKKEAFVERVGAECHSENMPFFLEILTYDATIEDNQSIEYAKIKPHKVNQAMEIYSQPRFQVDVLKVEIPVNMAFVEGFSEKEVVYTQSEAAQHFKAQANHTSLPYIFLSAGVSAQLFQETLIFAHKSGATFNGVLCGRATWAGATQWYRDGNMSQAQSWLTNEGVKNIEALNKVLETTATPIQSL